jgi:hypothetical protein
VGEIESGDGCEDQALGSGLQAQFGVHMKTSVYLKSETGIVKLRLTKVIRDQGLLIH